jgi:hypothetical protein
MPAHDITTSYYLEPGVMTAPGAYGPLLAGLPPGIAAVAEAAHGLLIHEHIAGPYGGHAHPGRPGQRAHQAGGRAA